MSIAWDIESKTIETHEGDDLDITFNCVTDVESGHFAEIVILSSTLPSGIETEIIKDGINISGVRVHGKMPSIINRETYRFTARLQEYHSFGGSKVIDYWEDAGITIINEINPPSWKSDYNVPVAYINTAYSAELVNALNNPNGDENYRKSSGELPLSIILYKNGTISGSPVPSEITYNPNVQPPVRYRDPYVFGITVYRDNDIILEEKQFSLDIYAENKNIPPTWITESGVLNSINAGDKINDTKVIAIINSDSTDPVEEQMISYELVAGAGDLPTGLSLYTSNNQGIIAGILITSEIKTWQFTIRATRIHNGQSFSSERIFYIKTNEPAPEHKIDWCGDETVIDAGTYSVGTVINQKLPKAVAADGNIVKYSIIDSGTLPSSIAIDENGSISGIAEYPIGEYTCTVRAYTDYTYVTKLVKVTISKGLGKNALDLSLRINLEYKSEYNDIKAQLNTSTAFSPNQSGYMVDTFPKINIATLTCFDREILASIFNFGAPEIVRFLDTRYKTYSDIDINGEPIETYEAYYKAIDENTYQWDEIKNGNYDFQSKMELQIAETKDFGDKTTTNPTFGPVEEDSKLEFNNQTARPNPTNQKQWIKHQDPESGDYYQLGDVNIDTGLNYKIFNIKHVRAMLQKPIYVYKKSGDYYYDIGNQQLFEKDTFENDTIITKKLFEMEKMPDIENSKIETYKFGNNNTQLHYYNSNENSNEIYDIEYNDVEYYISDEDGNNPEKVMYKNHLVYDKNGNLITNILFKPEFNTHPFMISSENGEIYNLEEISNPWCIDRDRTTWFTLEKVPADKEMVLPRITDDDIRDDGESIVMLDTSLEPLPKWKRKEYKYWEAETTFDVGDIIYYNSVYYLIIKKYTSEYGFEYNSDYMRELSNSEVKEQLSKQYFPTLDLGYFKTGKNRKHLKDLNKAEIEQGKYWYRKDFLFWDITCTPVYNDTIDTFGVPFYSFDQDADSNSNDKEKCNFTLDVHSNSYTATLIINGVNIITASEEIKSKYEYVKNGDSYKVTVDRGTIVEWSVTGSAEYYPEGKKEKVVDDVTKDITLKKKIIFTINTYPEDCMVTLITSDKTIGTNTAEVRDGDRVRYKVEKEGYITESGAHVVTSTGTTDSIDVEIVRYTNATFTINTVPEDAIVTMVVRGKTFINHSAIIPEGATVTYSIQKQGYLPIQDVAIRIEENTTIDVELTKLYTYTINPIPSDGATVTITADGYTQEGKSISAPIGTEIRYSIAKYGYETVDNVVRTISGDYIENVELTKLNYTFTVNVTNVENPTIKLKIGQQEYTTNTIIVPYETTVEYTVSKENYKDVAGSEYITADASKNVTMVYKDCNLLITTIPDEAIVKIAALGQEIYAKSITVPYNTEVVYDVQCEGYFPKLDKHITLTEDNTYITVELEKTTFEYNLTDEEGNSLISEGNNSLVSETYQKDHPINNNGD